MIKNNGNIARKILNRLNVHRDNKLFTSAYFEYGNLSANSPAEVVSLYGDDARVFDLASLSKPLVTAALFIHALDKGRCSLDQDLQSVLDEPQDKSWREVLSLKLYQVLSHSSGLKPWCNFYTQCSDAKPQAAPLGFSDYAGRWQRFEQLLKRKSISVNSRSHDCYSDIGYILSGIILERIYQKPLNQQFQQYCHDIGLPKEVLENLGFLSELTSETISTGYCQVFDRMRIRQCFDENAVALGQVCGHAGLFATGEALGGYIRVLFGQSASGQRLLAQAASAQRQGQPILGLRIGDDPAAAPFAAGNSLGHYGFTGTSFWINPTTKNYYILLTNRTCFKRLDGRIRQLRTELAQLCATVDA